MRLLGWIGWVVGGLLGALVLASVVLWIATQGDYRVPATVVHDSSLPQIEVDGILLHAEAFGTAANPPVVVLHGGPGADYRNLLPLRALADQYYVIFYDQRGSGLSQRVDDSLLNVDSMVEELDGVIDEFVGDRQVRIIGHSWGGMLAAMYLARHPERVSQAVLAEPGFLTPETGKLLMDKTNRFQPQMSAGLAWYFTRTWFESLHVDGPDDHARGDYMMDRFINEADLRDHPLLGYFCQRDLSTAALEHWRSGYAISLKLLGDAMDDEGNFSVNPSTGIEKFHGPILLLASECNTLIGEEQQERHLDLFNNARLEVVRDSGHTMFGEQPEQTQSVVRQFFDSRDIDAQSARP